MEKTRKSILLVEDESDIRDLIYLHLNREGYQVEDVANGEEALQKIEGRRYDLMVLDWMLPGMSGLEITRRVRSGAVDANSPAVPILMVTAKAESRDIIDGLESGADDYLTKPFEIQVLLARVRALLRRSTAAAAVAEPSRSSNEIRFGDITIRPDFFEAYSGKEKLQLTRSEFRLLEALACNKGRVLTRDKLIGLVQGEGVAVTNRTIDTHVFGLRKKLGKYADVIETIRGVGYRVPADI